MLALEGITRRFGAVTALDQVTLTVRPGTVHALLGENGAGKTTLMRIAFGALPATSGQVRWQGAPVVFRSPADALAAGIGMVHQHFTLVPSMTVAENVALGGHGRFDPRQASERARTVAARAGLAIDPDSRVHDLAVGAQQRCEIVKALARDAQLLILDEPTAVLAPQEARDLLAWVRTFAAAGKAVVLITHKLRDALAVADDVTVLHRGRVALAAPARALTADRLAAAMLGHPATAQDHAAEAADVLMAPPATPHAPSVQLPAAPTPSVRLRADAVRWRDPRGVVRVRAASMQVHAGEIVGLAAVEGSGQHALLRLLAGRLVPESGTLERPPRVGFVPEDRHRDALLLDAPLFENLALRDAGARRGRMHWRQWRERTAAVLAAHDVRAAGATASARTLSGGNQQKFVLARELADAPEALVVENPSRGLDFKATAAVHDALRGARASGTAVVIYSSDLDEVLLLADRIYVLFDGHLRAVAVDRDAVGQAMLGAPPA